MRLTRRDFSRASAAGLGCHVIPLRAETSPPNPGDLSGKIGITTGSFGRHLAESSQDGKLRLLDLPKLMRDELDMNVLDLMTANLPTLEPKYLSRLRRRADQVGCTITNLKMNQKGLDMGSPDEQTRRKAVSEYKKTIDAASVLGCRWVRPLPTQTAPEMNAYVRSYRELIDYAADAEISLLIENFGWIQDDPDAMPRVVGAVGPGLDVSVDTGNWTDAARYDGLAKAYPLAVTCDFKAKTLGHRDRGAVAAHPAYDLKRCFQIGWTAGYRGPWFFEHVHSSLPQLILDLRYLRDMITKWTKQQ